MENKKTVVVNLFAGPGAGKSSFCHSLMGLVKWRDINAEVALEFAKEMVWEESTKVLENQQFVYSQQQHRLHRLNGKVDLIITDSPLLLSIIYDAKNDEDFKKMIVKEYNKYENINFFVIRKKPYNPKGRLQSEEQSRIIDKQVHDLIYEIDPGNCIDVDGIEENAKDIILPAVLKKLKEANGDIPEPEEKYKPLVTLSWRYDNFSNNENYMLWLEKNGFRSTFGPEGDILLLLGGADLGVNGERDKHEIQLVNKFIESGKPMFGICRGMQLLGAMNGLKLIQDIPTHEFEKLPGISTNIEHGKNMLGESSIHYVRINNTESPEEIGMQINSRHHQGFDIKGEMNSRDGITEAMGPEDIRNATGRCSFGNWFGVQWHPEREEVWGTDADKYVLDKINKLLNNGTI